MITNTELLKIKHALEGKNRRENTKVRMKFPSAQKDDNHQGKILVIDDEVEFLDGLMDVLGDAGYSVDGVYNPTVAIEKLRKFLYDIVLLDLKMPRLDGLAILAEIRNISLYTCIIVVTGFGTVENAVTAMKMGAWDFITKPFEMEKLLNMLYEIAEK
jgi:DNA-binding NtrC family response regulator